MRNCPRSCKSALRVMSEFISKNSGRPGEISITVMDMIRLTAEKPMLAIRYDSITAHECDQGQESL